MFSDAAPQRPLGFHSKGATLKTFLMGILIAMAGAAQAQNDIDFETGNEFLERAKLFEQVDTRLEPANEANMRKITYFLGAVNGIRSVNTAFGVMHRLAKSEAKYVACIPSGVTARQLVKVIKAGMEQTPESLHLPYALLSQATLTKTYPCRG